MQAQPSIVLLNITNKEKHQLTGPECIIGRGWLNCNDKRISHSHGILRIKSQTVVGVLSTHSNPIFYKKRIEGTLSLIENGKDIDLTVGDLFGLLPEAFWFRIEAADNVEETSENAVDEVPDTEPMIRVKTERLSDDESNNTELAAASGSQQNFVIKTEPDQPVGENQSAQNFVGSRIKEEIKTEDESAQGASTSNSDSNQRTQSRVCCKYGIRCYRRNPIHRIEEAHPGDADYKMPDYDEPPYGVPPCPFADRCYRRNPFHFKQFSHPNCKRSRTNDDKNDTKSLRRKKPKICTVENDDDEGNEEFDDPYATDEDSDFNVNDSSSESDDEISDNDDDENDNS